MQLPTTIPPPRPEQPFRLPFPIRDLLSPRRLWHLLQAWKMMRKLKGMYNRVMPSYGSAGPAIDPENLAAMQEIALSFLGDLDVEAEGQEEE